MSSELGIENWLALAFVIGGTFLAIWLSGRSAARLLKQDRKNHPPAE
ncbi:MAG: hypothetical protein GVY06_01850 [Alphaproteobacteria bacterium]|jgi:hypothetical protein|nr:hypothetical protein [Alphaproteobacteria bacterium]